MVSKVICWFMWQVQKVYFLFFAYFFSFIGLFRSRRPGCVIGVVEIASFLTYFAEGLGAVSVCFELNKYYPKNRYTYSVPAITSRLRRLLVWFWGPLLLAYLSSIYKTFIYLGDKGFLSDRFDGRSFELRFLHNKKIRIVCIFMGSEIRSKKLMTNLSHQLSMDVVTTYQFLGSTQEELDLLERKRELLARSANSYAGVIINAPTDQISYLERIDHPFIYVYPDKFFERNDDKFLSMNPIKILHAPSSPIIKGTPLVRAAIKKLKSEGYSFQYTELIGKPNDVVIEELRNSHIVLNEFYAFLPGLFGVEAMASHCALLTSADDTIENTLPFGSNEAWVVTPYYDIYDKLKWLLDNPGLIKQYADSGYSWARAHASASVGCQKLEALISEKV